VRSVVSFPFSPIEPVTDILHGVRVDDPYRWLEDGDSPRTRAWISEQTRYARCYLDALPKRERIRTRIREFLSVETYDSFQRVGNCYIFRKRSPDQEQPCICMREGPDGEDQLLLDPATRGTGKYTSVLPLRVSPDGRLLLYEVKQGGERMGTFEIFDIPNRKKLPDSLPHGYLRGFEFARDGKSFYYVHEASGAERPFRRAAFHHTLETSFHDDREILCVGDDKNIRLSLVGGNEQLGFLAYRFLEKTYVDFYLWTMDAQERPEVVFQKADYAFAPRFLQHRILAATDRNAPNLKIVEVQFKRNQDPHFYDVVPEHDAKIRGWHLVGRHIIVSYTRGTQIQTEIFDSSGKHLGLISCENGKSLRVIAGGSEGDEVFVEHESFTKPIEIVRYSLSSGVSTLWAQREAPLNAIAYTHATVSFPSKDGTKIPMFLLGKKAALAGGLHPIIMTAYGGYGIPMTPQFSVMVAFFIERGCIFALPNIRGGSEFGAEWHNAAKRRNRQVAFDDFVAGAQWLVDHRRTDPERLAIFGGSNSGLLVAAAMTQRPDLFGAVLCLVPLTDMLRYHRFNDAHVWKDEFGVADDPNDFAALANYSPYHKVRSGTCYPATMIVSGDADEKCNPLHARKMVARLQAASVSERPILLDYSEFRGHSPVLPLSTRIDALTDRVAFLYDQLRLEG
jgi:prolyl oligopeptidase